MKWRIQTGKFKEEQRLMKRQDRVSYLERLKGFNVQLKNVEREPMSCRTELSQSCHKEDRSSIPTESAVSVLRPAQQKDRREVSLQGFGGVLSPCFLLEITSHPFILLQGRPFTHRDLFSSSLLNLVCTCCCTGHNGNTVSFQAGYRSLSTLESYLKRGVMSSYAIPCSLLLHLGPMIDTAALGHQLPVADLPLSPVLLKGLPLPSWPHWPCQGQRGCQC